MIRIRPLTAAVDFFSPITETLASYRFLGADGNQWVLILLLWAIFATAFTTLRGFLAVRLGRLARRTSTVIDDVIVALLNRTRNYFLLVVALYLAVALANAGDRTLDIIGNITVILFALQAVFWGNTLINFYVNRYKEQKLEEDAAAVTTVQAAGFISRLILLTVVLLLALDNMGVDITALIAGMGIGGIAVALAVQNVLGDLFASLSIVLDKPFVVGDFLIVDDYLGVVERIGLKTTRIRSLSGEQVIMSNSDLLNSRIRNYKRMFERRVVFGIGITYQTPRDKVAAVSDWLREIVEEHENARFDRAHFKAFGAYSLDYEIVYYVLSPDFNTYMDIQQSINLSIFSRFEREGVEFAYPTQMLYADVSQSDGSPASV